MEIYIHIYIYIIIYIYIYNADVIVVSLRECLKTLVFLQVQVIAEIYGLTTSPSIGNSSRWFFRAQPGDRKKKQD